MRRLSSQEGGRSVATCAPPSCQGRKRTLLSSPRIITSTSRAGSPSRTAARAAASDSAALVVSQLW